MGNYYYFAASLEMLRKNDEKAMNPADFLQLCREQLSSGDFQLIADADAFSKIGETAARHPIVERWLQYNDALKRELAAYRAGKLADDMHAESYTVQFRQVPEVIDIAKSIDAAANPLDADSVLFESCWNYLDQLEINHFFDLDKILIYYLKLQLLERQAGKTKDHGREVFRNIFSNIQAT